MAIQYGGRSAAYTALWGGCLLMLSQSAAARFAIPGYELVYTAPVETALQADDLRNTAEVWREMFDAAKPVSIWGSSTWRIRTVRCWTACCST